MNQSKNVRIKKNEKIKFKSKENIQYSMLDVNNL